MSFFVIVLLKSRKEAMPGLNTKPKQAETFGRLKGISVQILTLFNVIFTAMIG